MVNSGLKNIEIGSHRKYSRKGSSRATEETFKQEMLKVFLYLGTVLKRDRYACFVIGNSTLNGKIVYNHEILSQAAFEAGFSLETDIIRQLQDSRKSFNPKIGKIKEEHICIFKYTGNSNV